MASPQRLASKLCSVSPRLLPNVDKRLYLSPKSPTRETYMKNPDNKNQLSPFSIDTPNRRRILANGLPNNHATFLGCGGFGTVYKASYKGDQVAAKLMETEKCLNALSSEKRASFLKHSNIVRILMIEEGSSLSLITMELCGTTLQDRLDQSVLMRNERWCIVRDISCGLEFCHDAGIVHADVKPKNILISVNGQPKLTDFGSSVLIEETEEVDRLLGTPGYVAPEVIKGNRPTPASDVYSLGVVAWQMLSRQMPFDGLHSHTIIYLTAKGQRPQEEDAEDEFDEAYKTLYRKMWSQLVEERPTTAEIIREIEMQITS